MLCYPDKHVTECLRFFQTRYHLHQVIYKHKTVCSTAQLICDVWCRADPFFRLFPAPPARQQQQPSKSSSPYPLSASKPTTTSTSSHQGLPMSRAMLDPAVFLQLNDSIMDVLWHASDPRLQPAKDLLWTHYQPRVLYKCVATKRVGETDDNAAAAAALWNQSEWDMVQALVKVHQEETMTPTLSGSAAAAAADDDEDDGCFQLTHDDVVVEKCTINYGRGTENPLEKIRFVPRSQRAQFWDARTPISQWPVAQPFDAAAYATELPRAFQTRSIRFYVRNPNCAKTTLAIQKAVEVWWNKPLQQQQQPRPMLPPPPPAAAEEEAQPPIIVASLSSSSSSLSSPPRPRGRYVEASPVAASKSATTAAAPPQGDLHLEDRDDHDDDNNNDDDDSYYHHAPQQPQPQDEPQISARTAAVLTQDDNDDDHDQGYNLLNHNHLENNKPVHNKKRGVDVGKEEINVQAM